MATIENRIAILTEAGKISRNNPADTLVVSSGMTLSGAVQVTGSLVTADLVVQGTTTSVHSENVSISDNHLYLNAGYETVSAVTGGLVVNYLPTATTDGINTGGFTAGVAATSNPTVITDGTATFSAGDLIQVSGTPDDVNDGLYEVLSHVGSTLTIKGIGTTATTQDWVLNQFTTSASTTGSITKVNVSIIRSGTDGNWEVGKGSSTTGFSFTEIPLTVGTETLQDAYTNGQTITLSDALGDLVVTLDSTGTPADFQVTATAGDYIGTQADNALLVLGSSGVKTRSNIPDNTSSAFQILEGSNSYLNITTTNGSEQVAMGMPVANTGMTLIQGGTTGGVALSIPDNQSNGLRVAQSTNIYLQVDTTDGSEVVTLGSSGVNSTVNINAGTGTLNIGSSASARSVNLGTGAAAQTVTVGSTNGSSSLTLDAGTGTVNIATSASARSVNVATGGAAQAVTLGSTNGASSLTLDAGTGTIGIGTSASARTVNIATGAAAQAVTLGSTNGASSLTLNAGSGTIGLGTSASARTVNLATGAAAQAVTLGSTNSSSATTVQSGTGGLSLTTTSTGATAINLSAASGTINLELADNAASALSIKEGSNSYLGFRTSDGGEGAVFGVFVGLSSNGAGLALTSGAAIAAGDVVSVDTTNGGGRLVKADANGGGTLDSVIGIALDTVGSAGSNVRVATVVGSLVTVTFDSAPADGDQGKIVYLSTTAGVVTLTAPSASGSTVFRVGVLQNATTTKIVYMPQYIGNNP